MTDYGFYTTEEIKQLADSDLSFEIADAALLKTKEADQYLNELIQELKCRDVVTKQITVIRKIVKYEEHVFDNEEQFNQWKNLPNDECNEFNDKNFVDIWYNTRLDVDPDTYVALKGDQTQATDDWIFTGIFEEAKDQYSIDELEVIDSAIDTLFS